MGKNNRGLKVTVAVLAALLVIAVSVIVGLYTLGGALPSALRGGGDDAGYAVEDSGSGIDAAAEMDMAEAAPAPGTDTADNLVRYASLTLQVDDVPTAVEEIRDAASAAGGSIQSADLYSDGGYYRPVEEEGSAAAEAAKLTGGYLTVRVLDTELESFLDSVRGIGRATAESVSTQDVTTQYADLDARIPILEAERESLTAMLARATTVEEELMIRDRLVAVTAELQSLTAQREVLADQDVLATVTISLTVPPSAMEPSSVDVPWFSWYELQLAIASGVAGFQKIVYGFLTALIATAPLWIPLTIVLVVRRRRRQARLAVDSTPVAAPVAATTAPAAVVATGEEAAPQP